MSVLVTGGTGLIGSQVVADLAARGEDVVVISRKPVDQVRTLFPAGVRCLQIDIRNRRDVDEALAASGAERIIHLAALLSDDCERDPASAVDVNLNGTVNLLEGAVGHGAMRFVFASSIALYGAGICVFAEETLPETAVRLYGQTKQTGETLCERYRALHGLDCVSLRYGGVFGAGGEVRDSGMSGLRHLLKQTMWGRDVTLDGASGDECFQYIYVKDAARATLQALDRVDLPHRAYNVAGPLSHYVSLRAFHDAIRRVAPGAGKARFSGRSHSGLRVSIDRLQEDFGFEIAYSVEDGLRDEYETGQGDDR